MSFKALASQLERAIAGKSLEPIVIHVVGGLGNGAPVHTVTRGRFTVVSTLAPSQFLREKALRSDAEMELAIAVEVERQNKPGMPEPDLVPALSEVDASWNELTHLEEFAS
jgi:hypothetical protein